MWTFVGFGIWSHKQVKAGTEIDERTEIVASLAPPGTRIAIWAPDIIGPPMFHFRGNYLYARGRFDDELLRQYPRFTVIFLPEMPRLLDIKDAKSAGFFSGASGIKGVIRSLYVSWKDAFPERQLSQEFIMGESSGVPVSLIAYRGGSGIEMVYSLVHRRFSTAQSLSKNIMGDEWTVIPVSDNLTPLPFRN